MALRSHAKLSQAVIAEKIASDQSRVSRIESGELVPNATEVKEILESVGTTEALRYLSYLQKQWRVLPRPRHTNPDLDGIWRAEQKLQRLSSFEEERNPP